MASQGITIADLVQVLSAALDAVPERRQPAEALLQSWEPQPAFPSSLHAVISDTSIDTNIRWLASVCLKNCVIRWWHKRITSGAEVSIRDGEKAHLRAALLARLDEPHTPIAKQLALALAKITRNDWPEVWPDLFPTLLTAIQQGGELAQRRALLYLHAAVKEISSKKVGPAKKHFQEATPQVFGFLLSLYTTASAAAAHSLEAAELEFFALKIMRRLLCYGFARIDLNSDVATSLQGMLGMMESRSQHGLPNITTPPTPQSMCSKSVLKASLIINELQRAQPLGFTPFLQAFLHFSLNQLERYVHIAARAAPSPHAHHDDAPQGHEVMAIRNMMFISSVLSCPSYRPGRKSKSESPESAHGQPLPTAAQVCSILEATFTPEAVAHLTRLLLTGYLPLKVGEVGEFERDPEGYLQSEFNEEGLRMRPTAENLLSTLMQQYKETVGGVIVDMLHQVSTTTPDTDHQAILMREALYNAAGLCCYELQEGLRFEEWFSTSLVHELQGTHPLQFVLRRRVAWLIGSWVDSFKDPQPRDAAYRVLTSLQRDPNMAVRIAASDALLKLVDDVSFFASGFDPHLPAAVSGLFDLLAAAREVDTRLRALNVLSIVMEGMGDRIAPVVPGIVAAAPALWAQAQEEHLMKGAVLVAIARLVSALGEGVAGVADFVTGVVAAAADVRAEDELYTLEDGLGLWLAAARNLPAPHPPLAALFPNVVAVVERDFEFLQLCLHVAESHILLAPADFLAAHGAALGRLLVLVLGDASSPSALVKDDGALMALEVVETLLAAAPAAGAALLEACGLAHKLLAMALADAEAPLVAAQILCVLARLCAADPPAFRALLARLAAAAAAAAAAAPPPAADDLALGLVDRCLDRADHLRLPRKRRVVAAAAAALLALGDVRMLERTGGVVNLVVEVLHQERRDALLPGQAAAAPQSFGQLLARDQGEDEGVYSELEPGRAEAETGRRRRLEEQDPLLQLPLGAYLEDRLRQCAAAHGAEAYGRAMATVDPDVLAQLQRLAAEVT